MNQSDKTKGKSQKPSFIRRRLVFLVAIMIGLLLADAVVLYQMHVTDKNRLVMRDRAEHLPLVNAPQIGGAFALYNQDGRLVTDKDVRGKYLLIYFGYTYCPDMCPTGLTSISHVLNQLGSDRKKVQAIFVTIDPARDTQAKIKEYVSSFHPDIFGLRGSDKEIATMAKAYHVHYRKAEQMDEDNYMMDHTTLIYLMGPDGRFIQYLPEDVDPQTLLRRLHDLWGQRG